MFDFDNLGQLLFVFFVLVLPVLQWVFKKLFQLTQTANRAALDLEQRDRAIESQELLPDEPREFAATQKAALEAEDDRIQAGFEESTRHTPSPPPPPRRSASPARPKQTPRRRGIGGEISRFLEDLADESRRAIQTPQDPKPVVAPAAPRPLPAAPPPSPRMLDEAPPVPTATRRRRGLSMTRNDLAKMIVWSELLAPPIALRDEPPGRQR